MKEIMEQEQESGTPSSSNQMDKFVLIYAAITCAVLLISVWAKDYILIVLLQWFEVNDFIEPFLFLAVFLIISYSLTKKIDQIRPVKNDFVVAIAGGSTIFIGMLLFQIIMTYLLEIFKGVFLTEIMMTAALTSLGGLSASFLIIKVLRKQSKVLAIVLFIAYCIIHVCLFQ